MKSNWGYLAGIALFWLVLAIPTYTVLRRMMLSAQSSLAARGFFVFISGAVIGPGFLSLGHPPPIPIPFMAMLFALTRLVSGGTGEDAPFFLAANLVSWLGVTGIIGLIELVRLIDSELQPNRTSTFIEEDEVLGLEGAEMEKDRAAKQSDALTKPRRYVAEFTFNSSTSERITFHRAVVEQEREDLTLSVYEGELGLPLQLIQTYVARNWDELSLYLQSKTHFRRNDFHGGS